MIRRLWNRIHRSLFPHEWYWERNIWYDSKGLYVGDLSEWKRVNHD